MAVITKITTQQKNHDRYNIFTDDGNGEKFSFSVDEGVLIKYQLKKGLELDEFSILEIHYQDDIRKAYNLAVSYLARRMRSEKEIRTYLAKKEIEKPVIQEVIHKLMEQTYLDDQGYANAYLRTQINTTDKGPDVIRIELKEKGIEKSFIDTAMSVYSEEAQFEKAVTLAEKVMERNSRDSYKMIKQKIENLLLRKGYPYRVINRAVNDMELHQASEELEAIRYQGEKLHRKYCRFIGFEYEQKMKQALYRKGFTLEAIETFLNEQKSSD